MKKLIILAFGLISLTACGNTTKTGNNIETPKDNVDVIKLSDISNVGFQTIKEGEKIKENTIPVVKDMECPKEKVPVCGQIGTTLNGYLNKCEAERHGAKVIAEGFCKLEALKEEEKCDAEFLTIGNCEMHVEGFVFNKSSKTCEKVSGNSCEGAQIPFTEKENCEKTCQS